MDPHQLAAAMFKSFKEIRDPGASGTIAVAISPGVCYLVTAAAEARTLPRPTREGASLFLFFRTDGGDCTVTVTGGVNLAGDTTIVFTAADQWAYLVSFHDGSDYVWRTVSNSFLANAPIAQGAALTAQHATLTQAGTDSGDVAIQALTQTTPFGFVNAAEGEAVIACVLNLMVRCAEIEARLEAARIVAAN